MNTNDTSENYIRCEVLYEMMHSLHERICRDGSVSNEVHNASLETMFAINNLMRVLEQNQ